MDDVTCREYEPGDWPRVRAMLEANDEDAGDAGRVLQHDGSRAWVAEAGDELVGWVLTRPVVTDEGYHLGGIEDLVVDEPWRGQGIGRRLMEMAEDHFRAEGLAALQLTVRADNQVALNLYRSLGFSIKDARLRMRKSLGPDPRTMQ